MLAVIEKELIARERSGMMEMGHQSHEKKPPTATTLLQGRIPSVCCYCNQQHKPSSCMTVVQVDARKGILKKVHLSAKGPS